MVLCLSLLLAFSLPASAQEHPSTPARSTSPGEMNMADRKFMEEAAKGGATEVALGQLALQKASDPAVKKFAQRMVDDHTKVGQELQRLAVKKGMDISTQPAGTPASLATMSGAQFDQAYVDMMVKEHQKDVAAFEKQAQYAHDSDIREFASRNLPTLKDHLSEIQNLKKQH